MSLADNDELVLLFDKLLASRPLELRVRDRALSFPEKVKKLIEYQKLLAPLLRAKGYEVKVWEGD